MASPYRFVRHPLFPSHPALAPADGASSEASWYEDDELERDPQFFTQEVADCHVAFQKKSLEFERSREREALCQALHRCQGATSITKVICLDMGRDEGFTTRAADALLEHVAALQLARHVEVRTGRNIALLSQGYTAQGAFTTMLKESGFSINEDPRHDLFREVDENSLVILVEPPLTSCLALSFQPRPAMLVTTLMWDVPEDVFVEELASFGLGRIRDTMFLQSYRVYREYLAIPWASECCASPGHCDDALHSAWIYQHQRHVVTDGRETPGRGSSRRPRPCLYSLG